MKPLIPVKHSVPEVLESIPAKEWKLSQDGRARAYQLAERLREYQLEVIVSSIEPKACETARIPAEHLGLEFRIVENLHEHDRSHAPYYFHAQFQAVVREFFEHPDTLVFGQQTANQALTRFRMAVDGVLKAQPGRSIAIVANGTVILSVRVASDRIQRLLSLAGTGPAIFRCA